MLAMYFLAKVTFKLVKQRYPNFNKRFYVNKIDSLLGLISQYGGL